MPTLKKYSILFVIAFYGSVLHHTAEAAEVKLAWNKVDGDEIAGYTIYIRASGQDYDFHNPSWSGKDTSCTITGLDAEATYFFVARTFTVSGIESLNSNEVCNYRPVLLSPSDAVSAVILTPALKSGALSDPAFATIHAATQWQISTSSDFDTAAIVYDHKFSNQLYSINIIDYILNYGNMYYWRVRNFDHYQTISDWSAAFSFTTMDMTHSDDQNGNGIPDDQELKSGVDDILDLDQNNVPDIIQNDIKALKCVKSGIAGIMVHETDTGISDLNSIKVKSLDIPLNTILNSITVKSLDTALNTIDFDLPLGLISMEIQVKENGAGAKILLLYSNIGHDILTSVWYQLSGGNTLLLYDHAFFETNADRVALEFKDGAFGDEDGVENRKIVHTGMIGVKKAPAPIPAAGESGSSGGGGCFISSAYP